MNEKNNQRKKSCYICAPASSMRSMNSNFIGIGIERLKSLGYSVKFGNNVMNTSEIGVADMKDRLEDFLEACEDEETECIIPVFGGYNSNALLSNINYDRMKESNKLVAGYSDITALLNAIYKKTGVAMLHGLSFSALCEPELDDYAFYLFSSLLEGKSGITIRQSEYVAEDLWYFKEINSKRERYKNQGWQVISEGTARGTVIGGNLETFLALAGTDYMPEFDGTILLAEAEPKEEPKKFLRDLNQLQQMRCFDRIKGMIIGSFSKDNMLYRKDILSYLIHQVIKTVNFPILANTNFSHIDPIYSLMIGGTAEVNAIPGDKCIKII